MAYFLIVMLAFSSYLDSSSIYSAAQSSSHSSDDTRKPWLLPFLPETITPTRYDLHITPNFYLNNSDFVGRVSIKIKVLNRTNFIIVHMKNLKINTWKVLDRNGMQMNVTKTFENKENNYWVVQTKDPLRREATLNLTFKGNLSVVQQLKYEHAGLYKIPFINDVTNKTSWFLASDFYPSYSRYAFPNFDEPRFKARFNITIRHMKNFTALSNMPEERIKTINNYWQETTFKESPKMSSYHVGFTVSEFKYKGLIANSTLYRVWARPKRLDQADYALNVTPIIENFLRKEFGMLQVLQKIDQFAVPGNTLDAERKNWGLDTYRESRLLVNMTKEEDPAKFRALTVIAQAMTHNYFGNLVTCRFWSHIWLNEGLTAFYEVKTVTSVDPSFGYKEVYFGEKVEPSMILDATNASRALVPYAEFPKDGIQLDSIYYKKSAAILRMVENFVGTDAFRRGIRRYLSENSLETVSTEDLWSAIQREVDPSLDINTIMRKWIFQRGIPIIKVELLPGNKINATQKQFIEDFQSIPNPSFKWYVPLTYRTKGAKYGLVWMNETDVVFGVPLNSSNDWIEFNVDRTGYYRVNYDATLWNRITKQLTNNYTVFSELTRSMLLSDSLHVAKAEQLGYQIFLGLTKYASVERGVVPWHHINDGLNDLKHIIANTTIYSRFQKYVLNLTSRLMDELQVKDEGCCLEKKLRPTIMSWSCSAGHRGCIRNTTRLFKAWIRNESVGLPADFKSLAYCFGMAHSTLESEWNTTFERYRLATMFDEKFEWLWILSCSRNSTLLERLLDFNIDGAEGDDVHINVIVRYIAKNPSTADVAWNWLKRRYAEIDRKVRMGFVGYLLSQAVHSFKTRAQLQEVLEFYTVYTDASEYDKIYINNTINRNIRLLDGNFDTVGNWLRQNVRAT